MRWLLVVFIVLESTIAHASRVGVVITGDAAIQTRLTRSAKRYLEAHGHTVALGALEPASISTLLDCLSIDDTACARGVIDKRANADAILVVRTELATTATREVTLGAYWLAKGHSGVAMRRVCEKCSDEALDSTFDAILADLVKSSARGRLVLRSKPPGLLAVLDNQPIGSTPLERDVPVGQHQLALVQNGKTVAQRYIAVEADGRVELDVPIGRGEASHHSRTLPALVLGVGIAGVIGGGVLYATSEKATGEHPTYRDTKALGIGVAAGAAVLVGVGVFLLLRGGDSGPTIDVAAGHATAGWIGRF